MLDIVISELVTSDDVKDTSIEISSLCDSETERSPFSDIRCDNDTLNAECIDD